MKITMTKEETKAMVIEGLQKKYGAIIPEDHNLDIRINYNNEAELTITKKTEAEEDANA